MRMSLARAGRDINSDYLLLIYLPLSCLNPDGEDEEYE